MEKLNFDSIDLILEDIKKGIPIVLVDDKDRENEGDIVVAAECITQDAIAFMFNEARGLVCVSLTQERVLELAIPMQTADNKSPFKTNFSVSVDSAAVVPNGVTAASRAHTIKALVSPSATPEDFLYPGYVFPVVALPGGVLQRRGQTEGSVDLSRLAGLSPAGVICEIMDENGQMVRGEALANFCNIHQLKVTSVEEIVRYRLAREVSLRRVAEAKLEGFSGLHLSPQSIEYFSKHAPAELKVFVYADDIDGKEQLAIVYGEPKNGTPVRIHSECLTGDVFESARCDCGGQFDQALQHIVSKGSGVVVYLHQEGRGIGLGNKLRAYELQDQGLDTVEANLSLGFEPDERDYRAGAQILSDLGLSSIKLITNNPKKVDGLTRYGIEVVERVALTPSMGAHNQEYLKTKRDRLGHLISI